MPRYFFDTHNGDHIIDECGTALPSLEGARIHAVAHAGGLLSQNATKFWGGHDWRLEVYDETRLLLFQLNFSATAAPAIEGGLRSLSGQILSDR